MSSDALQMFVGGCHCGAVRFEVRASLEEVLECNCSICTKKGWLHVIVPKPHFVLLTDEAALSTYRFGTKTAQHHFCATCGVSSFYVPRSHPDGISVNARCLDGVDPRSLSPVPFDGQNWERNVGTIQR
jgi:hypothetical protein